MLNDAIVILSYTDTDQKVEILKECILQSKKSGFKIILSTGFEVSEDIQSQVDYLIFDKENPIIKIDEFQNVGGAIFFWLRYPQFENAYCVDLNHSYAVLKLMKNASAIAKINGIEKLHFLNYDYIIEDTSLFIKNSEILDENDLFYYTYLENDNYMNTSFFSVKTSKMLDCFNDIKSKSIFCEQNVPILEEYILKTFRENKLKYRKDLLSSIEHNNKINLINICDFLTQKKIGDKDYNLYVYLSKDTQTEKYFLVAMSEIETELLINLLDETYVLNIGKIPQLVEIDKSYLNNNLEIIVNEFDFKDNFNWNKKVSHLNIFDFSIVKNLKDLKIKKYMSENNTETFYDLSLKNNTDKVYYHGYHFFYTEHFEKFRFEKFNMLEIGYGDGASMKTWVDYFPEAQITVMDINVELHYNERCQVIKSDQSKKSDLDAIINKVKSAKLILDDGSHNPLHQFETFNHLFKNLLEPGGIYIIEDIEVSYWNPESSLYGYTAGYFNLIDAFRRYQEMINSEFTGVKNYLDISSITFGQNCIIIKKRTNEEKNYFDRIYRFEGCVNGICHF